MNKKEYLRKLRRQLKHLPNHIVEDILRDYEDHFNDGLRQGLSESQISRDLGDPADVASEYLKMYPKMKKSSKGWDVLWALVVVIVGIWALLYLAPTLFKLTGSLLMTILSLVLFLILLTFILVLVALVFALVKGKRVFDFFVGDRKFSFKSNYQGKDISHHISETRTITQPVSKLVVESYLSSIVIQQENRNDIYVELVGYSDVERSPLVVEVDGSVLKIIDDIPGQTISTDDFHIDMKLTIRLPKQLYDLEAKARIGSLKIYGDFNESIISAKLGSLKIDGNHSQSKMLCEMGSMKVYNNFGHGTFKTNLGSITWHQSDANPHRFVITKSLGSFKNNSSKVFNKINDKYQSLEGIEPEVSIQSNLGSIKLER